jgi:hypothetical protein
MGLFLFSGHSLGSSFDFAVDHQGGKGIKFPDLPVDLPMD